MALISGRISSGRVIMASKSDLKKREEYRALVPRIHEVQTRSRQQFNFNIRTDYDQKLWPAPEVEKHGTG